MGEGPWHSELLQAPVVFSWLPWLLTHPQAALPSPTSSFPDWTTSISHEAQRLACHSKTHSLKAHLVGILQSLINTCRIWEMRNQRKESNIMVLLLSSLPPSSMYLQSGMLPTQLPVTGLQDQGSYICLPWVDAFHSGIKEWTWSPSYVLNTIWPK